MGGNLASMASFNWKTYITYYSSKVGQFSSIDTVYLDITNKDEVEKIILRISPKVIIHTAAVNDFNFCADHRELAWKINVDGTRNIALAAEQVNAKLIYISTDLVFEGDIGLYSENDCPNPLCHYGKTKLEGEKIVSSINSDYCIARTALLYGWSKNSSKCFTEIMIDNLKKGKELRLFTDEFRSPLHVNNLCQILLELAKRDDSNGLYHIGGSQRMSRFLFGLTLADIFGLKRDLIIPTTVDNFLFKDKRPKDCSMKNEKILNFLNIKPPDIIDGLSEIKEAI